MGKLVGKRWLSEQRQRQQRSGSSSRETRGAPRSVERALSWRLAPALDLVEFVTEFNIRFSLNSLQKHILKESFICVLARFQPLVALRALAARAGPVVQGTPNGCRQPQQP